MKNQYKLYIYIATISLITCLLFSANVTALSYDSFQMLMITHSLININKPQALLQLGLSNYPIFVPIMQLIFLPIHKSYSPILIELLSINGLVYIAYITWHLLKKYKVQNQAIIYLCYSLPLLCNISSRFLIFQFFYLEENLITGIYLLFVFGEFLIILSNKQKSQAIWLPLFLLMGYTFLRMESFLFELVILISFHIYYKLLVKSDIRNLISTFFIGNIIYLLLLLSFLSSENPSTVLSKTKAIIIIAMLSLAIAWLYIPENLFKKIIYKYHKVLFLCLFLLAILAGLAHNFHNSSRTVHLFIHNMLDENTWGFLWYFFIMFFLITLPKITSMIPIAIQFLYENIINYLLFTIILGMIRSIPYRAGWGDSGNRMLSHIVFIILLSIVATIIAINTATKIKPKVKGTP